MRNLSINLLSITIILILSGCVASRSTGKYNPETGEVSATSYSLGLGGGSIQKNTKTVEAGASGEWGEFYIKGDGNVEGADTPSAGALVGAGIAEYLNRRK
jgi:hypothetical protein